MTQQLSDALRAKLDDVVSRMQANNESDENIQAVVDDFKSKYAPTVQPTLVASRKEIAKQQFDQALPLGVGSQSRPVDGRADVVAGRTAALRDSALGYMESFGVDPSSPVLGTAKNIASGVYNALGGMKGPGILSPLGGLAAIKSAGQGIAALPGKLTNPTDATQLGEGAGQLTQAALAAAGGAKAIAGKVSDLPFNEMATDNTIKALSPRTREMKAVASKIGPALAERRITGGVTGGGYDNAILDAAEQDGLRVHAAEELEAQRGTRLPEFGNRVATRIKKEINKLTIPGEKGEAVVEDQPALDVLQQLHDNALKIGNNPDIGTVIKWRRALDQVSSEKGAFKQAASVADRTKIRMQRAVGNIVRDELNQASPDILAPVNHDYHISRAAADIVEDRQLGKVGQMAPSTVDAFLSLGGYATEGAAGAIAVPAARALWRSRGIRSQLAAGAQGLADRQLPPPPFDMGSGATPLTQRGVSQPPAADTSPDSTAGIAEGIDRFKGRQTATQIDKAMKADLARRVGAASSEAELSKSLQDRYDTRVRPERPPQLQLPPRGGTSNVVTPDTNAGTKLWSIDRLPPSPTLDRLTAGVDFNQVPKEEMYKLDKIAKSAASIQKTSGVDPIQTLEHMAGSPQMRARLLTRPEGRNVIDGLFDAMRRQSAKDTTFYTGKLNNLILREVRRGSGAFGQERVPTDTPAVPDLPPRPLQFVPDAGNKGLEMWQNVLEKLKGRTK